MPSLPCSFTLQGYHVQTSKTPSEPHAKDPAQGYLSFAGCAGAVFSGTCPRHARDHTQPEEDAWWPAHRRPQGRCARHGGRPQADQLRGWPDRLLRHAVGSHSAVLLHQQAGATDLPAGDRQEDDDAAAAQGQRAEGHGGHLAGLAHHLDLDDGLRARRCQDAARPPESGARQLFQCRLAGVFQRRSTGRPGQPGWGHQTGHGEHRRAGRPTDHARGGGDAHPDRPGRRVLAWPMP